MAVHKVAYDLNNPGKNYTPLIDYLKRLDSYHGQKSMWYVNALTDCAAKSRTCANCEIA